MGHYELLSRDVGIKLFTKKDCVNQALAVGIGKTHCCVRCLEVVVRLG